MFSVNSRKTIAAEISSGYESIDDYEYNYYIMVSNNITNQVVKFNYSFTDRFLNKVYLYWNTTNFSSLFNLDGCTYVDYNTNLPTTRTIDGLLYLGVNQDVFLISTNYYININLSGTPTVIVPVQDTEPVIDETEQNTYQFIATNNINSDTYSFIATEKIDWFGTDKAVGFTWNEDNCPFNIEGYLYTGMYETNLTKSRSINWWYSNITRYDSTYLNFVLVPENQVYSLTLLYDYNGVEKSAIIEGLGIGQRIPHLGYPINDSVTALFNLIPNSLLKHYTLVSGEWDNSEQVDNTYPFNNKFTNSDITLRITTSLYPPSEKCKVYIYLGTTKWLLTNAKIYGYIEIGFYENFPTVLNANKYAWNDDVLYGINVPATVGNINFYGVSLFNTSYDLDISEVERTFLAGLTFNKLSDLDWSNNSAMLERLQNGEKIIINGVRDYMLTSDNIHYVAPPDDENENFLEKWLKQVGAGIMTIVIPILILMAVLIIYKVSPKK
jgi:hypothetical protein